MGAIHALGGTCQFSDDQCVIRGCGGDMALPTSPIDAKQSGIVYRYLTALMALQTKRSVKVMGDVRRPITPLIDAINGLGAHATFDQLVTVKGPIEGGSIVIDGKDSQPVSALLLACALSKTGPFEILVINGGERPWIDLSLYWLKKCALPIEEPTPWHFFTPGGGHIAPFETSIPADFSSAAFAIGAALSTKSSLTVEGLDFDDVQGDQKAIDALIRLGARISKKNKQLRIDGTAPISGGVIDVAPFVDALPLLTTLGCFATSPLRLIGGAICRHKESDRIKAITCELKKMGAAITEHPDGLTVTPSSLHGANVEGQNDHRIAMSLAVAAMGATGPTDISGWACTRKTYPHFREDFAAIGAKFE